MITTVVRRIAPLIGLAALLVGFMRPQQAPPAKSDLWFHLRFGHEFIDGWHVRSPGNLGPFDTAHWIPTQWLSQVIMAGAEERWGLDSVIWGAGAIILVLVVLLYTACRRVAAPLPAAMAVALGAVAASPGLSARPQVLSYLFVVLTVGAWLATWQDSRPRYWIVVVAWVWTMCHGMWPVGISISCASVIGLVLERRLTRAQIVRLAAIPAGSALVALLTPVGWGTYGSLVVVGNRSEYFDEWGAPDFTSPTAAVLAAIILIVAVSGLRASPVPWMQVTLFAVAVAWSLYSMRTTVVGALVLTPLLAVAIAKLVPPEPPLTRRERRLLIVMAVVACAVLWPVVKTQPEKTIVPSWVDERLDAMASDTRILNDWDTGSWFLYRHPELDFVMHGYGDVFTDSEIERNFALTRLRSGWDEQLIALDVDAALLDPQSPLGYALEHQLNWEVQQSEDGFVLLTPPA